MRCFLFFIAYSKIPVFLNQNTNPKNLSQRKHPKIVLSLFDRLIPHRWRFFNLGFKPLYCTAFFSLWHILRLIQGVSNLDYKGLKIYVILWERKNGRNFHSIWEEAMRGNWEHLTLLSLHYFARAEEEAQRRVFSFS